MSQQTVQPVTRTKEEKSVATKEKLCHNRVDKMKRKMLVATKKIMSRQFPEAEVYKELDATNFVSRQKTFLLQQEQDYCIKTLSRHYQSLSRHNPRQSSENLS